MAVKIVAKKVSPTGAKNGAMMLTVITRAFLGRCLISGRVS